MIKMLSALLILCGSLTVFASDSENLAKPCTRGYATAAKLMEKDHDPDVLLPRLQSAIDACMQTYQNSQISDSTKKTMSEDQVRCDSNFKNREIYLKMCDLMAVYGAVIPQRKHISYEVGKEVYRYRKPASE